MTNFSYSPLFLFCPKPNQTRVYRTWSIWTLRSWWSLKKASRLQWSWWPPRGRRNLPGPVTSARHVCSARLCFTLNASRLSVSSRETWGLDVCLQSGCTHTFPLPHSFSSSLLQCIDNIRCNGLMMNAFEENSKVTVPQMIKWAPFMQQADLCGVFICVF